MSDIPNVNDPVLAVVVDRFTRMEQSTNDRLERLENTLNDRLDSQDERMRKIEEFQGGQIAFMNKWKGGAMVLAGLGTAASYFMGAFEWVAKYLSMKH